MDKEFQMLILALQFTVLFDKLKKKYNDYISVQDQLTWKENQEHLREIGTLTAKVSQISIIISKNVMKKQLGSFVDKTITWASNEKAKSLVSDTNSKSPIERVQKKLKRRVLSEFSWFPRSRL